MNILTSFPFTFKLTVPGLSNPFTSLATNPPSPTTSKNLPVHPKPPVLEADARTRSLVRPTRPLPISISPRPSSRNTRPAIPAFPATSASLSRAHGQSHLAPLAQFQAQGPPAAPVNRKRGWEPSYSPSPSEATLASSNGYFETPARYRELGGQDSVEVQYVHGARELDDDDMPPAKRRRGLAGSIVSSAWSAALMGTAVGLTVYKLWRDRGKTDDDDDAGYPSSSSSKMQHKIVVQDMDAMLDEPSSPPPPYNHEWGRQRDLANETSDSYLQPSLAYQQQILQQQQQHLAPKSRGRHRPATVTPKAQRKPAGQSTRRPAAAKSVGRAVRSRPPIPSQFDFEHPPSVSAPPAPAKRPRSVHEPSYASSSTNRYPDVSSQDVSMEENEGPEGEDDDQMDWLGGKLAQLIEEGKKALGKEVVVCSDAKEDEVDDGSGAWVSDDEYYAGIPGALGGGGRVKRRSSVKGRAGRSSTVSNGSSGAPYGSTATQVGLSAPSTPSRARYGVASLPASPSSTSLVKESEQLESPEVREMMEKARAKMAARMGKA